MVSSTCHISLLTELCSSGKENNCCLTYKKKNGDNYLKKFFSSKLEDVVNLLFAEVVLAAHAGLDHQVGQHHLLLRHLCHPLLHSVPEVNKIL